MKNIDKLMEQFTGRHILDRMADGFRMNDQEFRDDEDRRTQAEALLRKSLPADFTPSVDEYIAACERDVLSRIVYAGYHGFQANLANFHEPYGVDIIRKESFDIVKEHIIGNLPANDGTYKVTEAFYQALPEDLKEYYFHISEYYTHFECAGPKLAHYAGYILGNNLLYWIQPGYQMDPVQTMQYTSWIGDYCGFLPL